MNHARTLAFLTMLVCCSAFTSQAQTSNTQLWADGILGRSFGSYYMAECEFSYQTLLSDQDRWESLNISPSLEVSPTAHWSFMVGLPYSYTIQRTGLDTEELRAQFGLKYNFTPFNRVQLRLNARYELRRMQTVGEPGTERAQRSRLRAECVIPLDVKSYDSDTMWYGILDGEAFITVDQDVSERFANRMRLRAGLGRKFCYNWRAELIYTLQRSRDAIADEERSTDNIIRLRVKYYFTPRSRSQAAGDNTN
ncbi:MAG: DUF2490 domain-containing protein [Flavobacteriales bacterium]|nr:DUF2490 domain-containing protein [Flavobacteriales bacterium]